MRFSDDFVQELKQRNDISDVVSAYVGLRRSGRNMVGLCPFHSENSPSFYIYPSNGSFYCFGCGTGGDIITFIMMIENIDYMESIKLLSERAGMTLPIDGQDDESYKRKILLYEINREAAKFYYNTLCGDIGKPARDYLIGRGISVSCIKHFGLGYSPNSKYALINYLKGKGYKEKDIILANLAFDGYYGKSCDRFYDRIMFPIIDLRGNVIAFGGRTMGNKPPKYLNTSDTPVFKKGISLFAMNFAKLCTEKKIVLSEGYMDVISLHQAGFINSVATLGTALTQEQAKLISRYAEEAIISYDSDEAGRKAASRAISILRDTGLSVRVITIPKGKDPDEYIRYYGSDGPVRFKNLIEQSANDIEYKIQRVRTDIDTDNPGGKVKYLTESAKILASLNNPIEREVYIGKLSSEMNIDKSAISLQVNKYRKQKKRHDESTTFKQAQKVLNRGGKERNINLRALNAEESLLSYIINNQDKANNILSKISENMFIIDFNKRIYKSVVNLITQCRDINISTILTEGFSIDESGELTRICNIYSIYPIDVLTVNEYISIMKYESERLTPKDAVMKDPEDVKNYIKKLSEFKK